MPTTEHLDARYTTNWPARFPGRPQRPGWPRVEVVWIVTVTRRPSARDPDGSGGPRRTGVLPHRATEVKYHNLSANPQVLVLAGDTAWDHGLDVVVEGTAVPVSDEPLLRRIADLYRSRWDGRWRLDVQDGAVVGPTPDAQVVVFEVVPDSARSHSKGDPFGQTNYGF